MTKQYTLQRVTVVQTSYSYQSTQDTEDANANLQSEIARTFLRGCVDQVRIEKNSVVGGHLMYDHKIRIDM